MNPRRCTTPLWTWREAVQDDEYGPQPVDVGGTIVSRRTQVAVAVAGVMTFMSQEGNRCWPSVDTISGNTGIHPRTVQRGLAALVTQGFLAVRRGGGRGKTNHYAIRIPDRVRAALIAASENGGVLPPFLAERVASGQERVAVRPLKGGVTPPEGPIEEPGSTPAAHLSAVVLDLAAARARRAHVEGRAAARVDLRSAQVSTVQLVASPEPEADTVQTSAEPPVWTWVWWFAYTRGERRTFPQLASGGEPPDDVLSWDEYDRLEAEWRLDGCPSCFDPSLVAKARINFSLKEVEP